jgi:Icc-related predicted phosphoesterase
MKSLYQRRTDGDYKGYTKESFYFNSTEQVWCWKQESKNIIHKASTIEELKKIKNKELIGQGNYDHKNDSTLASGHTSTEEFAKITGIGSKEYVSMLLKRGTTPIKEYDQLSGETKLKTRKKKGLHFIDCLKKAKIEYLHTYPQNIYNTKYSKDHYLMKQKIWVFRSVNDSKIKEFKKFWNKK